LDYLPLVNIRIMDRVAGQYAIYGLDDVILNTEGRMQMRYNIYQYLYNSCYKNRLSASCLCRLARLLTKMLVASFMW